MSFHLGLYPFELSGSSSGAKNGDSPFSLVISLFFFFFLSKREEKKTRAGKAEGKTELSNCSKSIAYGRPRGRGRREGGEGRGAKVSNMYTEGKPRCSR